MPEKPAERELDILYEISCAMRTTLDLEHTLYIILTGVTSHLGLGFNRAVLYLLNPDTATLECRMAIGPESGEHADTIWTHISANHQTMEDLIEKETFVETAKVSSLMKSLIDIRFQIRPNDDSLLAMAYEKASPWHIPKEEIKQYSDDSLLKIFKTDELIIMPMKAKDKVNGLIIADNLFTKKPISDQDIKIFTMLANQAGLAIENARLYEMVVHQSQTDSLTGLWNHGYFQKTLTEQIEQSKRTNQPMSLVMADLDDFKNLNDTCGHQHGDKILKEFTSILKKYSRDNDHLCRYGGEEFAIILEGAAREHACDFAERIRAATESYEFSSPSGVGSLHLTVSLGVASFPRDAASKNELVELTDKAMYAAKFSGKNQTCVA